MNITRARRIGGAAAQAGKASRADSTAWRTSAALAKADLSGADEDLFQALKELRMDFARDRGVPAYVIFSDRSLLDMATTKPANEVEFAEVYGVGEAKLKKFAPPFLALIADFG